MKRKIVWITVSSLMVLSLVLASCGTTAPEEEEEEEVIIPEEEEEEEEEEVIVPEEKGPKYGGTITLNSAVSISTPDPMQPWIAGMKSFTYDRLGVCDFTRGPGGTGEFSFTNNTYYFPFVGALAESWEQTGPYTFIIHLRQGVHWHNKPPVNGRELTADDVVYTVENLLTHPQVRSMVNPLHRESITALDKYTIELKSNTLDVRFLWSYMIGPHVEIRPPEAEETYGVGFSEIEGHCGTGPYIMTDFTADSSATLERNPDYFGYDEFHPQNQLPYADSVKFLMITDTSTIHAALRTAKLDWLEQVNQNDAETLIQTSPELKYLAYIAIHNSKLSMRQDKAELPFSDIRVRKALSMAIDREAIIEDYFHGKAEILTYPVHPSDPDVYIPLDELPESTREQFEYNPEKARQLLADAGYPGGFQTECIVSEMGNTMEQLQILVAYWNAIGINCEIQTVDTAAMWNLSWGRKYEQLCFGGTGMSNPINSLEERTTASMDNYDLHADPEYDAKVAVLLETQDEAERNKIMKELLLSWHEGINTIQFPAPYDYNFWWPWLKDYQGYSPPGWMATGNMMARLWIDQELKKEMGY